MINQELVDLLNNTRIGKVIRLLWLDYKINELKEILEEEEFSEVYSCLRGEDLYILPPKKFSELSHKFLEKLDKLSKISGIEKFLASMTQISIDFSAFQGDFSNNDLQDLKRIMELLGVKILFIRNIREDINLEGLPVDEICIIGGKCNFANLGRMDGLRTLNVEDYDINNLSNLECLTNLSNFSFVNTAEYSEEAFERINNIPDSVENCYIRFNDKVIERKYIIVTPEQLKSVLENAKSGIEIIYCGGGPIKAEWFEGKKVQLEIESTLALDDEFCKQMENLSGLTLKITNDRYPNYSGAEISAINSVIRDILAQVPENADDFTKVATVYKILAKKIKYDKTGHGKNLIKGRNEITRSLKGALLENKAVCEGYSEVLHKILNELGIESTVISGEHMNGGEHAWNQVKIDGQWYNVDLNWDSTGMRFYEPVEYFLKNNHFFEQTHKAGITRGYSLKMLVQEKPEILKKRFLDFNELTQSIHETAEESYDYSRIYDFFHKGDILFHTVQTSRKLVEFIKNYSVKFLRKSQIGNAVLEIMQDVIQKIKNER